MSDYISSVIGNTSSNTNNSSSKSDLKEETKRELQKLGLNPDDYSTEKQAQEAIEQTQLQQQAAKVNINKNKSEELINSEIKYLALRLRVLVADDDTIEKTLANIAFAINEKRISAGNDKSKLSEVKSYQNDYENILTDYAGIKTSREKLSASMNNLASYNKIYQNL